MASDKNTLIFGDLGTAKALMFGLVFACSDI